MRFLKAAILFVVSMSLAPMAQALRCDDLFASAATPVDRLVMSLSSNATVKTQSLSDLDLLRGAHMEPVTLREVHNLAAAVADEISTLGYDRDVRTVLYPAVGFDAGLAFRIFPSAETVIGIDNHPFWFPERAKHVDEGYAGARGHQIMSHWSFVREVHKMRGVKESVVNAIRRSAPTVGGHPVRILRVIDIDTPSLIWDTPVVHGIVEFDNGPGTLLRRYIHINSSMSLGRTDRHGLYEWRNELLAMPIDAIFQKAGMQFFVDQERTYAGLLVKALRRKGGVIIDGDSGSGTANPVWPLATSVNQPSDVNIINTKIRGLGYGYVQIVKFSGSKTRKARS